MQRHIVINAFTFILLIKVAAGEWNEELALESFDEGSTILAHFTFTTSWTDGSHASLSTSPELYKMIKYHRVLNLEATLTRGRWPLVTSPPTWWSLPPPGLEVRIRFRNDVNDTRAAFHALSHSLSALLGTAVHTLATSGVLSAPAIGWFQDIAVVRQQIFGALPSETPCAESIAAWLKLLPCRDQLGLAEALVPGSLLAAPMHSMSLNVDVHGGDRLPNDERVFVAMQATVLRSMQNNTDSLLNDSAYSAAEVMQGVFGLSEETQKQCPEMARSLVLLPRSSVSNRLGDAPVTATAASRGCAAAGASHQVCALYGESAPVKCSSSRSSSRNSFSGCTLEAASRVITKSAHLSQLQVVAGAGAKGGRCDGQGTLIHFSQMIPWELPLRWHSLKLEINGRAVPMTRGGGGDAGGDAPLVVWKVLRPSTPHLHGHLIELLLRPPPRSTPQAQRDSEGSEIWRVTVTVDIEKRLLSVFDFPPDASRGIDIPGALISWVPSVSSPSQVTPVSTATSTSESASFSSSPSLAARVACGGPMILQRHCAVHLVNLPIPDASMPFNVVCFSSTVVAVLFGALLNTMLLPPAEAVGRGRGLQLGKKTVKQRLLRVVIVLGFVGIAAVYMDRNLQRQVNAWASSCATFFGMSPIQPFSKIEL